MRLQRPTQLQIVGDAQCSEYSVDMEQLILSKGVCQSLSHVQLFATSRTVAHQAPLSMEFSSQEYWSLLSFPPPGILLTQRSNPSLQGFVHGQADSLPLSHLGGPLFFLRAKKLWHFEPISIYIAHVNIPLLIKFCLNAHKFIILQIKQVRLFDTVKTK